MKTTTTNTNEGLITATTYGVNSYTRFGVHTRTRYGVYNFVGAFPTRKQAYRALAIEVGKGYMANAWVRFEDDQKICEWDHEFDTMADADNWADAF